MNFTDLPIEVGVFIIKYLDSKSKVVLYSCYELRKYFAPCHVRKLILSRSTLSTPKIFEHEIVTDLGKHVQDLDLSGIPYLTASILKNYITLFTILKSLDVTFTEIYLSDLLHICPDNLKKLSINFFPCPRKSKNDRIWNACKDVFIKKQFDNVHFIVFELLDSDTPLWFLANTPFIEDLKITVADNYRDFWDIEDYEQFPHDHRFGNNFSKLTYAFRDCRVTHKTSQYLKGVANLDFETIEYIFIMYLERIVIYTSPIFKPLFSNSCSDLTVEVASKLPEDFMLDGNIIFKAWSKSTNFDENFMADLLMELRNYFPTYICMHNNVVMNVINTKNDWYCIDSCNEFDKITDLPVNVTLTDFCRKDGAVMRCNRPFNLFSDPKALVNITFMRLSNVCIREDFFGILFSACLRLATLDIYVEKSDRRKICHSYTSSLPQAIHLAKTLKNIKLTTEDIDYNILFDYLSKCQSLENVHICDYERVFGDNEVHVKKIEAMIENCVNLYSIFIEADMSPEALTILMSPLRDIAQKLNRDHLCIEVCDCYRGWNPFADIFNPSPLHILD